MSARVRGPIWSTALALAVLCWSLVTPPRAHAVTCDPSHFPGTDEVTFLNLIVLGQNVTTMRVTQGSTFWAGMAVLAYDGSSDYDVKEYSSCLGGGLLAASQSLAGTTDFVLGDFNENPTGETTSDVYCFGGPCTDTAKHAVSTWRSGSLMFVDFPATTIDFSGGPPWSPDRIMHVWDVFLSAGSTYYFQFSSTLGTGSKMALFRNRTGGVYWASRSASEFETSGCTSYTAPTTGYYGLVVVNDVWADGRYTVGVKSAPICACAPQLPPVTPAAVPALPTTDYRFLQQGLPFWTAVGARPAAGSDWDLEVSTGTPGSPGCPNTILANSTLGVGATDVVAVDLNWGTLSDSMAVRTFRFSGTGGATTEWAGGATPPTIMQVNGEQEVHSWGPSDMLQCRDVLLGAGKTYTFQFFPTSNIKLLLFRNSTHASSYSVGRSGAVLQATGTATYTAPETGYYGLVVVKDDDLPGTFAFRVGTCYDPLAMVAGVTDIFPGGHFAYRSIAPAGGRWTAVGSRCALADWDVAQYGTGGSAPWPDCFTPVLATSEGTTVPDFIVGDFHYNAPGVYPLRFRQFTSGTLKQPAFEWTGDAVVLAVNGTTTTASPAVTEVLRCYEAYLVAGTSYQITYTQSANRPLLVFGHPGGTDYWAGRGAAQLSTLGSTTFTPLTTGDFAFVIANDLAEAGSFSLRISTVSSTDAGPGVTKFATRFLGAQPNPGRADLELGYTLARAAHVRFELLDASGRRAWIVDEGVRQAGAWSAALPRGPSAGARLPAGLYFARFEVDGHAVEVKRITLLD